MIIINRKPWWPTILSVLGILTLMFFIGCGGGGGDSSQKGFTDPPGTPASKEQLLRSIEATVNALEQETDRGRALEKVSVANQLGLILDRKDIHLISPNAQDKCMTVETSNETMLLSFDGTAECNGFSGRLEVTPAAGNEPDQNVYVNNIKLVAFSTGDGCPVSGEVKSQITIQGNHFTDQSIYANLDVCGQQFSGQVVFSGDNWETESSQLNTQVYNLDDTANAQVDVVWQIDTSTLDGESLTIVDDHALTVEVNQIIFIDFCNLPKVGTLTVKDPAGRTTIAVFADTTCETPEISVNYDGAIEKWPITAQKKEKKKKEPITAGVKIIGKEETVFDWSEDRCIQENIHDIPDSRARAFRDKDGKIQLISTHFVNRRMIGDTLETVKRECRIIMDSNYDTDPSKHNDREWLSAFYTEDGNTIYALVHNEYHGWKYPDQCQSGERRGCWYNSVTLAVSEDGGLTYSHTTAPSHLVAAIPYKYISDESPYGILGITNIIFNERDKWFYNLLHFGEYGLQKRGVCIMRTKDLSDPKSWRAWDGNGFNVRFANPYTTDGFDPSDHICEPISYETLGTKKGNVTYNTFYEKYLLVSTGLAVDSESGEIVPGFYFLLSDDLMYWSSPQLIKEAETWNSSNNLVDRFDFASLIDPNDTSQNFSVTGKRPYLYYVKWNKKTIYDRDLIRVQVEFSK